jgi:hypothetical protein
MGKGIIKEREAQGINVHVNSARIFMKVSSQISFEEWREVKSRASSPLSGVARADYGSTK